MVVLFWDDFILLMYKSLGKKEIVNKHHQSCLYVPLKFLVLLVYTSFICNCIYYTLYFFFFTHSVPMWRNTALQYINVLQYFSLHVYIVIKPMNQMCKWLACVLYFILFHVFPTLTITLGMILINQYYSEHGQLNMINYQFKLYLMYRVGKYKYILVLNLIFWFCFVVYCVQKWSKLWFLTFNTSNKIWVDKGSLNIQQYFSYTVTAHTNIL